MQQKMVIQMAKKDKRFVEICSQDSFTKGFYVIVDTLTGVNYLCSAVNSGGGITPLLDAYGKVVISSLPLTIEE